jgi:hypothetical protein
LVFVKSNITLVLNAFVIINHLQRVMFNTVSELCVYLFCVCVLACECIKFYIPEFLVLKILY